MLTINSTVLLIIDVQGKLAHLMFERESLFENLKKLIKGAKILEIPILWTEQCPQKIGPTIPQVSQLLTGVQPIPKINFSCCDNERFMQELEALNRKQILITGIEAHICIYQTTVDLVNLEYEVQIVADAVSSRKAEDKKIVIENIKNIGASLTSTEMALFELLRVAEGPKFKEILNIVK